VLGGVHPLGRGVWRDACWLSSGSFDRLFLAVGPPRSLAASSSSGLDAWDPSRRRSRGCPSHDRKALSLAFEGRVRQLCATMPASRESATPLPVAPAHLLFEFNGRLHLHIVWAWSLLPPDGPKVTSTYPAGAMRRRSFSPSQMEGSP
jgi:hypothetical protein